MAIAVYAVLLWLGPSWLDASALRGLKPDQKFTAIDDFRGRMIQFGAGIVALGVLVFTGRSYILSREGHLTDRYTKAIEQLGSEHPDVRLGAIYALERIMLDSPKDHPTIVEVLAAFVRRHSPWDPPEDWQDYPPEDIDLSPLSTDVMAVITVLGRRPARRRVDERGRLNLEWSYLGSARLEELNLDGASLKGSYLEHAWLTGTTLRGASLEYKWPVALIAVAAAQRPGSPDEFVLRFELTGYPHTAPTAGLWDLSANASLPAERRPKGERAAQLFRADGWLGGATAMYAPWDRMGLQAHPDWAKQYPYEAWTPARDLSSILANVHEVLNADDYLGI